MNYRIISVVALDMPGVGGGGTMSISGTYGYINMTPPALQVIKIIAERKYQSRPDNPANPTLAKARVLVRKWIR